MNSSELSAIKESLLEQKSSILNKSNDFKIDQLNQQGPTDEAEIASQDISNSISIHLHERDRHALLLIEKALGRLMDGSYDVCESCGDQIGLPRLKARPFTTLCIACKEEKEESKKIFQ